MAKMFVVEIDPREKSIKKVEFNDDVVRLSDMYSTLECDMVERISLNRNTDLWIDEEGMLNNAEGRIGFFTLGNDYQLVGKGMICGVTPDGESVPFDEEKADFIVNELAIQF